MKRRPTAYGLLWLVGIALFALGVWYAMTLSPYEPIRPGELKSGLETPLSRPGATLDQGLPGTDLTLRGAELTVSSADGHLRMHVYADMGQRRGNVYSIEQGAVQFSLENEQTLLLRVTNATYVREAGVVSVSGTLTGYITEGGQYFQAAELRWDEASRSVSTAEVRYVGPSIEVRGERMRIDLTNGTVRFDGAVEVGV